MINRYFIIFALLFSFTGNANSQELINLVIPNSPEEIDINIWKSFKAPNTPIGKGHTNEWISKDGYRLAYDIDGEDLHWHIYNKTGKRLQANGDIAGYKQNGKIIYRKGAPNAHLKSGKQTNIKIEKLSWNSGKNLGKRILPATKGSKIIGKLGIASICLNISSIFVDSPLSPLYTFQTVGEGEQKRAYINFMTGIIYEWRCETEDCSIRRIDYFYNYDYINGEWRGSEWYRSDLFDEDGNKMIKY